MTNTHDIDASPNHMLAEIEQQIRVAETQPELLCILGKLNRHDHVADAHSSFERAHYLLVRGALLCKLGHVTKTSPSCAYDALELLEEAVALLTEMMDESERASIGLTSPTEVVQLRTRCADEAAVTVALLGSRNLTPRFRFDAEALLNPQRYRDFQRMLGLGYRLSSTF